MPAGPWRVEEDSEIGFVARELLVHRVKGRFRRFEGRFDVQPGILGTTVVGRALAGSVETGDPTRDRHLREELLRADRFPFLELEGQVVGSGAQEGSWRLAGRLSIRGASNPVDLDLHVHRLTDAEDRWCLEATALTTILRSAFGLRFPPTIETGGVVVADEVDLILRVRARPTYFLEDEK